MPAPLDPPNQTQPPTPSRDDPREAWQAWARAEFPAAAEAAAEAALNVIDAGGEAAVAVAAAHRAALLRSVSASPPPPPPGPVVSPDGRHWWDGAAWREVQVTPATATLHDIPPLPGPPPVFGPPPPPWAAPPPPPAQPRTGRLLGAGLGVVAVLAAVAVVAISLVVHRSSSTGGGAVAFAPGSTHCTYRVSADSFSLIADAANAPIDCGAFQAGLQAAEQGVGATVTPIVGLPSGATVACSHQFGSSGYAVTLYRDPSSGQDGDTGQAFIRAACGAFLHVTGGG